MGKVVEQTSMANFPAAACRLGVTNEQNVNGFAKEFFLLDREDRA